MNQPDMPHDDNTTDLVTRGAVWTRYWSSGAAHSFGGCHDGRYQGEIARHWHQRFLGLESGQRVLDLATGNGALPRLLVESRPGLDVTIDAIDVATVNPTWPASMPPEVRQRLHFRGGVRMEALPFPDGSFDLVTSQYGFEYGDPARLVPELLRVTAARGRIALLMHASDSRPVALANVELAHLAWLLSAEGLLEAAGGIVEPLGRTASAEGRAALAADPLAEGARRRFAEAQQALGVRTRSRDGADVLFEAQDAVARICLVAARGSLADAKRQLLSLQLDLADSRMRLEQLRRHALDREQLDALAEAIRTSIGTDARIEMGEVRERGHLMGRTLDARLGRAG